MLIREASGWTRGGHRTQVIARFWRLCAAAEQPCAAAHSLYTREKNSSHEAAALLRPPPGPEMRPSKRISGSSRIKKLPRPRNAVHIADDLFLKKARKAARSACTFDLHRKQNCVRTPDTKCRPPNGHVFWTGWMPSAAAMRRCHTPVLSPATICESARVDGHTVCHVQSQHCVKTEHQRMSLSTAICSGLEQPTASIAPCVFAPASNLKPSPGRPWHAPRSLPWRR